MRSEDIIEALLGDEDEDAGLSKELTFQDQDLEQLSSHDIASDPVLYKILKQAVEAKELYLGRKVVKTMRATNRQGETFFYGKFGVRKPVIATLLYLDPENGWTRVEESKVTENEDDDQADFKDIIKEISPPPPQLPLGSISHATMRTDHLISAFLDALSTVSPETAEELTNAEVDVPEEEKDEFLWETILPALEHFAPPYTYVGSHPGDGADYGVWVSTEQIDDDIKYGELGVLKKGEQFLPGDYDYVIAVDERGDYEALLSGVTGKVIWKI